MQKEKLKKLCAVAGMLSLLLCGCQKAEVDYDIELGGDSQQESSLSEVSPLTLEAGVNWQEDLTVAEDKQFHISASIRIPDVEQMSVTELEEITFDEEYKKQVILQLFDSLEGYSNEEVDFSGNQYCGISNSLSYWLEFDEKYKRIIFTVEDLSQVVPEEYLDLEVIWSRGDGNETAGLKNLCTITEAEAKMQAEQILDEIGWTDPVWHETSPNLWEFEQGSKSETVADGYCFVAEKGDGAMVFGGFTTGYGETSFSSESTIYINDYGILYFEIYEPVSLVQKIDDVTLLSLDTVKGIIKKELSEHPEKYLSEDEVTNFTVLELNYVCVKDESREGYFSYVPAWRLSHRKGTESERIIKDRPVFVNAIDGSVIELEDIMECTDIAQ
ncbi:MAG: hypothetical protein J6B26_05600 [Agathobacter sp.]|nr:hypothetical protein [Agathobacter sp.]